VVFFFGDVGIFAVFFMIKPVSLTELFYFSCFDRLFYNAVAVFF